MLSKAAEAAGAALDGAGPAARFRDPVALAADGRVVYVADGENRTLRAVAASGGRVRTLAGAAGKYGGGDGLGPAAEFKWPTGLAVGRAGELHVADRDGHTVRGVM